MKTLLIDIDSRLKVEEETIKSLLIDVDSWRKAAGFRNDKTLQIGVDFKRWKFY